MNHSVRERAKSIIIILLLGCSLIQIGILWGDQSHGFPFNLLDRFFHRTSIPVTDQMTRDELFVPYRLVVSNGEEAYWVLGTESRYYNQLWEEAKDYLENISKDILKEDNGEKATWGDIITRKGFLIDFRYTIKPDLLAWFLENTTNSSNIPSVTKMMIVPESGDEGSGMIYINNKGSDYIGYKYDGTARKVSFDKIISDIDGNDNEYREYKSMHDIKLDSQNSVSQSNGKNGFSEPDVLYILNEKLQNYNIISCSIPQSLGIQEELEDKILENNKDRFAPYTYAGFFQFSDINNKYKIYKNGLLEYDYLPQGGPIISTDGGAGKALWNSYDFISRINKLTNEKAEIHLSGASENSDGSFSFNFDYVVNGMPVYVDIKAVNGGADASSHAITIVADSKRVLKCNWQIRNFTISGKDVYNDKFFDIVPNNPEISYKNTKIEEMTVGYVVNSMENSSLEPVMVIDSGNDIKTIKMPKEKGG